MSDNKEDDSESQYSSEYENSDIGEESEIGSDISEEEAVKEKEKIDEIEEGACIHDIAEEKINSNTLIEIIKNEESYNSSNNSNFVPKDDRIGSPYLTSFEITRILGERTTQITFGAKPLLKNYKNLSPYEISKEELRNKTIPIKIIRKRPNGLRELWEISEMNEIEVDK
jgi:DNA-directed RNA polymerase subunit K/omega